MNIKGQRDHGARTQPPGAGSRILRLGLASSHLSLMSMNIRAHEATDNSWTFPELLKCSKWTDGMLSYPLGSCTSCRLSTQAHRLVPLPIWDLPPSLSNFCVVVILC